MAIATTIRTFAPVIHTGLYSWVNLSLVSTTGISPATPLTITSAVGAPGASGNGVVVTPYSELPNFGYKCRVTGTPSLSKNYLTIRGGDAVTG